MKHGRFRIPCTAHILSVEKQVCFVAFYSFVLITWFESTGSRGLQFHYTFDQFFQEENTVERLIMDTAGEFQFCPL
jgi:hypothetical protein